MNRRRPLALFVAAGFLVALVLAVLVAPHASSSPDGLEKVAAEQHLASGPTASTGTVHHDAISKGVAGAIGVVAAFGGAVAVSKVVKTSRSRRVSRASTA